MQIQGFTIPKAVLNYVSYGDREHGEEWLETKLAEVKREMQEMLPWIPLAAQGILDIGCGLGAIDILLARELGAESVHLLDGEADKPDERKKFGAGGTRPWNDVRIAQQFVRENLAREEESVNVNAYSEERRVYVAVDVILSLKSWCHHYPVETYLPLVKRSLRECGRLIVDVRKNTDARAKLESAGLRFRGRIGGTAKCDRLRFDRI